ncbi:MAG: calcium/sodium antiporter [Gammaproteobacteria bacterium]|nr:calcium/sodium antiporter [Rhodocyclaceae bacterium]MBU3908426.1 calcium/sodium antiporter [Gammaproteobacteria bacterium]MBU3989352.1 calcium/sodium antiporter [Gammaproteobacteria bacterium]MBU4005372.1 calcium/sodium antiporter [Gammaproteobacteria bacterium]MBU4021057.1 calcium/sodium antiporter [Gammaproteobacteria bacterium]
MDLTVIALFVLGLVLLVAGAEFLVRGAARLASRLGISPLVIGLTVVAFGTSAPELAVSVQAGLAGQSDIAVGNVVGSNIVNVLLILGISALIVPLVVSQQLVRIDVPLLIGASVLFLLMALDGHIGLFDGILLFAGIVGYILFALRQSRQESAAIEDEYAQEFGVGGDDAGKISGALPLQIALIVAGLAMLVLGSHWLVGGAVVFARHFGVSELIIGLTIVAIGTSLPELATSVVAALRGERDIAVGNVVGSGIFNILAIAGIAAVVTPGGLEVAPALTRFDIPVMIAAAFACLPVFARGHLIPRWQGALFIAFYVAYATYLVLDATGHAVLPAFSAAMLGFVLPLTAMTLMVVLVRQRASQ